MLAIKLSEKLFNINNKFILLFDFIYSKYKMSVKIFIYLFFFQLKIFFTKKEIKQNK